MKQTDVVVAPGDSAQDRAFILHLGRRTLEANVSELRNTDDESLEAAYAKLMSFSFEQHATIFIAKIEEERVGFLIAMDFLPDEVTLLDQVFVAYMAVEPEYRKQGIGQALLQAAEAWTRAKGFKYLTLMVTENNSAAQRLYEGVGFKTERRLLCKTL